MKPAQSHLTISSKLDEIVHSQSDSERAFYVDTLDKASNRVHWRKIDAMLAQWKNDCSQFDHDDLIPPAENSITAAEHLAVRLRDSEIHAPARVAPNGDGGIIFERKNGVIHEKIVVDEKGTIEWFTFRNSRLADREALELD